MSYENVIKVGVNLSTKPSLPDYYCYYTKDYNSTLEAYKYACELSLVYKEIGNGMVYLLLANIGEALYLPTFHTYEDDLGNLEFVTEHHVGFTKNINLCSHRLCLWYIGDESVDDFKESLGGYSYEKF